MRRGPVTVALAAALAGALLTGCSSISPPDSGPKRAQTAVDTPELRQQKKAAQIAPCTPGQQAHVDGGMPEVTLPCLGGGPDVEVSSLRGPMVVNLWASWCGPCRDELPIYEQFHQKYGDRVQVLGINFNDQMPEAAMDLLTETGATYPELADPNSDLSLKDPLPHFPGLPAIIFIDQDGTIAENGIIFKEIRSVTELEDLVTERLDVSL